MERVKLSELLDNNENVSQAFIGYKYRKTKAPISAAMKAKRTPDKTIRM